MGDAVQLSSFQCSICATESEGVKLLEKTAESTRPCTRRCSMSMEHAALNKTLQGAKEWANSPAGKFARIDARVAICAILVTVIVSVSARRNRWTFNRVTFFLLGMVFSATRSVVSYTMGAMQSGQFHNQLFVAWSCFLLLLLGNADSIAAFTFRSESLQAKRMIGQGIQSVYVLFLLVSYSGDLGANVGALLLVLWSGSVAKLVMRFMAYRHRQTRELIDSKIISDYMPHEHLIGGEDYDPSTMKGYKYIIRGEEKIGDLTNDMIGDLTNGAVFEAVELNSEVVTVEKVWRCRGRLLKSDDAAARGRKDLCLAFALFKLLMRRFNRYPLVERDLPRKSQRLVQEGLLSDEKDPERAFNVVEMELGFLHDFFYARYPSSDDNLVCDVLLFVIMISSSASLLFTALLRYRPPDGNKNLIVLGYNFDVILTQLLVGLLIILDSCQLLALVFSDWTKVKVLSKYVRTPSWHDSFFWESCVKMLCDAPEFLFGAWAKNYWKNAIGQCFVLDFVAKEPSRPSQTRRKTSQVSLTSEVKQALLRSLKSTNCTLTNGQFALHQNPVPQTIARLLHQLVRMPSPQKIMILHTATALCDLKHQQSPPSIGTNEIRCNHDIAMKLSGYCTYLLAFEPDLLRKEETGYPSVFNDCVRSAARCLSECKSDVSRYKKVMRERYAIEAMEDVPDIFLWGASLGTHIAEQMEHQMLWKLLAELWAELMWSFTPTSNADGHADRLPRGGELITHLWALLTHAAVLERHRAWIVVGSPPVAAA